jgi:nitrite reductase (NADH) small subunit
MSDGALGQTAWHAGGAATRGAGRALRRKSEIRVCMSQWIAVCRLTDIVPNTGVCALVGEHQVAVFRLDDDCVRAIGNHDPFSRANVLSRGIVGDIKGELVVASPIYKQHFSLISGQCLEDPGVYVPVFSARLEGDVVWVQAYPVRETGARGDS